MAAWVWSRVVAEERGTAALRTESLHCLHQSAGSLQGSGVLLTAGLADAELNVVSCLPHIRRGMRWKGGMKRELQREREWGRMGERGEARQGPVQCNAVRAGTDT